MATVVECPAQWDGIGTLSYKRLSVFLAGGITGCPDWQADMVKLLEQPNLVLFNPRRRDWPIDDPSASDGQVAWEAKYLLIANAVLFWFPEETLCPIALFELGRWMGHKPVFIGTHPGYKRRQDIILQAKHMPLRPAAYSLAAPMIHSSVEDLAGEVTQWCTTVLKMREVVLPPEGTRWGGMQ